MTSPAPTLICIYNADSGLLNALRDAVHKLVSPATYPCALCGLTYGAVSMKRDWRAYLDAVGMPVQFRYRDQLHDLPGPRDLVLPAVLIAQGGAPPEVLVTAAELAALPDLAALIALVEGRLAAFRP